MSTLLFRLVHYLPIAHLTLGAFSGLAALWVVITSLADFTPPGLDPVLLPGTVCRWMAVLYLLLGAVLQYRLSQSGHSILAQPSRLWILYVADQALLLVILTGVLIRGPKSRLYLAGLHHAVAALLIVAGLSLVFAAIDRLAAYALSRAIPGWSREEDVKRTTPLSIAFVAVATLLFLSIGYLEAQPLPNTESQSSASNVGLPPLGVGTAAITTSADSADAAVHRAPAEWVFAAACR